MDRLDDKVVFLVAGGWVAVVAIFAAFSLLDKKKVTCYLLSSITAFGLVAALVFSIPNFVAAFLIYVFVIALPFFLVAQIGVFFIPHKNNFQFILSLSFVSIANMFICIFVSYWMLGLVNEFF